MGLGLVDSVVRFGFGFWFVVILDFVGLGLCYFACKLFGCTCCSFLVWCWVWVCGLFRWVLIYVTAC